MSRGNLVAQLTLRNRVLEELVHNIRDLPKGAYPTSWPQYREWEAPDLGIEKIGSKSSVSQRQQHALGRDDVVELLGTGMGLVRQCETLSKGRPGGKRLSKGARIEQLEYTVKELTKERDQIGARYHEREAELDRIRAELSVVKTSKNSLEGRLDELMREKNLQHQTLKLVPPQTKDT